MLVGLGWNLARQGKHEEAKEFYRRALETHPGFGLAHIGLGQLHLDQGRTWRAITDYRKAADPAPKNSYFQYKLGVALARVGQIDQALAKFETEMRQVRDSASDLFPSIWEDTEGRSEWHRKVRTVYFAMTDGERAIVHPMRRKLLAKGCRVDSLTGDGVRWRDGAQGVLKGAMP